MPITQDTPGDIQDNGAMKKDGAEQSSLTITLSGTVVDLDDKPVANCLVWGRVAWYGDAVGIHR